MNLIRFKDYRLTFLFGIFFGLLVSYILYVCVYKKKYFCTVNEIEKKCLENNNCTNQSSICSVSTINDPKQGDIEKYSYILNIDDSDMNYYEVILYDKNKEIKWVKNNCNVVCLNNFGENTIHNFEIISPFKENINYSISKIPLLKSSFNPANTILSNLKCIEDVEVDYVECTIDKILQSHGINNIKRTIESTEEKTYKGLLSRKLKIFLSENDKLNIFSSHLQSSYLIVPSYGILYEDNHINVDEINMLLHENMNVKLFKINLENNIDINEDYSISCLLPNIRKDSNLPVFKIICI